MTGQDSVQSTVYDGAILWIWGDTNRPSYGLGNFAAAGATAPLATDPDVGVDLAYIEGDDGFARPMAPPAEVPGEGLTWLGSLMVVDDGGTDRLVATYGNGSTAWHAESGRFIRVPSRVGGASYLGDVLLFVADAPVGPWVHARTIATHDYTCYNPRHHPFFDDGTRVYFEYTYADTFSDVERSTPRYDYNQVMYRVDLAAPQIALPVAIYSVGGDLRGDKHRLSASDTDVESVSLSSIIADAPDVPVLPSPSTVAVPVLDRE